MDTITSTTTITDNHRLDTHTDRNLVTATRRAAIARRSLLIGGLGLAGAGALGASARATGPSSPNARHARIAALEEKHGTTIGFRAVNLRTGKGMRHRDNLRLALCSTFKPFAVAALLRDHDSDVLATPVPVRAEDSVANSPIFDTRIGGTMTYAEFCDAALRYSDNASANMILRRIGGPSAVTRFARSIGDRHTRLDRWETELNSSLPHDLRDTSTAAALATSYTKLLLGNALADDDRDRLLGWMLRNQTAGKVFGAGIPDGWPLADKTGGGDYGSRNEVGITWTPDGSPIVMAALTRVGVAGATGPDACLADLARLATGELG